MTSENRFGVSLEHGKQFITALKNLKIKGYKVFRNYSIPAKSASAHAETFLWNVMEYKVSLLKCVYCGYYILNAIIVSGSLNA